MASELHKSQPQPEVNWEKYARLVGISKRLDLGDELTKVVENSIFTPEGLDTEVTVAPSEIGLEAQAVEKRLKALVEAEASWCDLAAVAWELYGIVKTPSVAAKLVEIAFLRGATSDCLEVMKRLGQTSHDFYYLIQAQVRKYLTLRFWVERCDGHLGKFLRKDSEHNSPIEKLHIFHQLLSSYRDEQNPSEAIIYFRAEEEDLFQAAIESGSQIKLSKGDVALRGAELALDLGYHLEAKRLVDLVDKNDPAFPEASDLYLKVKVPPAGGQCEFKLKLDQDVTWQDKVKSLYGFLAEIRRVGSVRDRSRPALNELFSSILEIFPKETESWAAVSQLIVNNSRLQILLPNLMRVYRDNMDQFHGQLFDRALWRPLMEVQFEDKALEKAWKAIAKFHVFLAGDAPELYLWDAMEELSDANSKGARLIGWKKLRRVAISYVAKSPFFDESRRKIVLQQLAIATSEQDIILADVGAYLDASENPPYLVLLKLQRLIMGGGHDELELRIIEKKAEVSHFTNIDLDQLWSIAIRSRNHDLAWRIATILKSRETLHELAEHPWSISGEKRDHIGDMVPSRTIVEKSMFDFNKEEKRFVRNILIVGPLLPDLFHIIDGGSRPRKFVEPVKGSSADVVSKIIGRVSWLPKSKKDYYFSFEGTLSQGIRIPTFMEVLPKNLWSLLSLKLMEHLGIYSWDWSLKRLGHNLDEVIPKPMTRKSDFMGSKISRWLRTLTPEQRSAWYELPVHIKKISQQRAHEIQALLVFRFAILLNQNHYGALTSLKAMRVPVKVIWAMENWLLSSAYSELRRYLKGSDRIVLPETIKNLPSIVGTSSR